MASRLALLICDNLKLEAEAALASSGFRDVDLVVFPSNCVRPPAGWEKITTSIGASDRRCSGIEIISSIGCIPQGQPPDALAPCRVHRLDLCAQLFMDGRTAETYLRESAYLLTPGWLSRWREYLSEWGFDQNTARQFFNEFTARLVLLDTGVDEKCHENIRELSGFLDLPFEVVPVGLDSLRLRIENIGLRWKLDSHEDEQSVASASRKLQAADYAMALDMVSGLAGIITESEAIDRVFDLFTMLFAPKRLAYLSLDSGKPGAMTSRPEHLDHPGELQRRLTAIENDYAWTESGNGFRVLVAHLGERLGVLEIDGIAFPEYVEHYLNLALTIGRVCGLAIFNARTYERMRQAEEALDAHRERLAVTLRSIGDGLIATDTDGRVVLLNRVAETLTGWLADEAAGRPLTEVFQIINERTRQPVQNPVDTVLRTGRVVDLANDTALIARDGSERAIADSAAPVLDRHGNTIGVVLVFRDVTQKRIEARQLETAHQQVKDILESITDAFFALDGQWRITYVNKETERLLRKTRDELMGHRLWDEFPEAIGSTFYNEYHRAVAEQVPVRFEEYYPPLETWFEVHAFPSRTGLSVYFQDINARKRTEGEIIRLNEHLTRRAAQLDEANKELKTFSYSVSHDLRAPLRAIDGFSQIILEDYEEKLDEEGKTSLHRIRDASQRMGLLIDAMLTLSRMTTRELRHERFDLSVMAESIANELRNAEPERKVDIAIQPGLVASGDKALLRAVLENLLGNAWKFTGTCPGARIEFGATEHMGKRAYFVRDNGAGFDMAHAGKLFGAFQRLHSAGEFPGMGIGLATVQRIVHRHGGRVWAEGQKNSGATIYFTL